MIRASEHIRGMGAYRPPLEARTKFDGLRLDFNERLSPLPATVVQAIRNFDPKKLMLYPAYGNLQNKLAVYAQVDAENLMITNGSDQGMDLIFRTFLSPGDPVIIPSPSFKMFYQVAGLQAAKIMKPEYGDGGRFPLEEVAEMLKKKPRLLVICNPNNPTGTLLSLNQMESILALATDTLIYIDEAYFEFSGVTAAPLIEKYPNLFITRTFSKAFGLAALRIGYVMSQQENISEMLKVRGPYDINQLAKVVAEVSLESIDDMQKYCDEVMNIAKPLVEAFFRKKKVEFFPSGGNFIYFREPFENFSEKLKDEGILIRLQSNGYTRVTIGTTEQMKEFIKAFNKLTSNHVTKIRFFRP